MKNVDSSMENNCSHQGSNHGPSDQVWHLIVSSNPDCSANWAIKDKHKNACLSNPFDKATRSLPPDSESVQPYGIKLNTEIQIFLGFTQSDTNHTPQLF